jgi:acetyl-CoA carboxylase biotin carboxyl carrier protein
MIDIRKLKELIKLMVENELSELDLQDQQETVTIKRGSHGEPVVHQASSAAPAQAPAAATPAPTPAESGSDMEGIDSPMVGTFYAAASPDSAPFVKVGDNVSSESVVCVVEAMKVFNEIKAECDGTIDRVLVKNGEAVEFGQRLFLVKPA